MRGIVGFRTVNVFNNVTDVVLPTASQYLEVTNSGSTDVLFYANDFPEQGSPSKGVSSKGIAIKAGTTREIPLTTYKFSTTGPVSVVAYTA